MTPKRFTLAHELGQALRLNLHLSQLKLETHLARLVQVMREARRLQKNLTLRGHWVLETFWFEVWSFRRVGRSALRPGVRPRACGVDRPPALFSQAEENLRPHRVGKPAFASSTGEGSGSGSRNPILTPGGPHGQA